MKRTLLFITFVLTSLAMSAQGKNNDNSDLEYLPLVESSKCWRVARTTSGQDNIDYLLYGTSYYYTEEIGGMIYYNVKASIGKTELASYLLCEENRKVYLYDPDWQDYFLLFDYSLKKGDTYETYSYDEQQWVKYKVLSVGDFIEGPEVVRYYYDAKVDSVEVYHRYLRKWTVCRTDDESRQKTWIEGIGSLEGPLANLYDVRSASTSDYLYYVQNEYISIAFPFYDTTNRVWHGCRLPTGAEDNWEDDERHRLTYELEGDCLHVYGKVFTNCGLGLYVFFKEEPTDDPQTIRIRWHLRQYGDRADCEGLLATDFYVPGFDPNKNYIVVDNQGEEHPVINRTPEMAYRPFIEDNKMWVVKTISDYSDEEWIEYYYFDGYTIVNNQTAKRMLGDRISYGQYISGEYIGAWFEQDKKVYFAFKGKQQFELLYDFTLSSGDSIISPDNITLVVNKLSGGITGFKGTYYEIGHGEQSERWLEGVGSEHYPWLRRNMNEGPIILLACTVGDEVIYCNSEIDDPFNMGAKKRRFDFNHTIKTQPKAPERRAEAVSLYGEYNDLLLDVNLNPLDDAYLVRITDKAGKAVYEKTINAGNIVALNIDISAYPEGQYTVTIENSKETFTGEFEIMANAIEETPSDSPSMGRGIYNLQGQKVSVNSVFSAPSMLPKGVYIINGKKIWVK
ncbi:MAG: DUF3244 domain-containing protein [Bacteroidaceae bacterium]|nr:DUF3244 domain-containing protein [Bacteroidaceae bacterium]